MLLAEYGLAEAILTMLWFFFLFMFIWLFVIVVSDLFRDHEESGWAKAVWIIALVLFPLLGVLVYLIVRGKGMNERSAKAQAAAKASFDDYVRQAAGPASPADELSKLADLKAKGAISDAEYDAAKAKILA